MNEIFRPRAPAKNLFLHAIFQTSPFFILHLSTPNSPLPPFTQPSHLSSFSFSSHPSFSLSVRPPVYPSTLSSLPPPSSFSSLHQSLSLQPHFNFLLAISFSPPNLSYQLCLPICKNPIRTLLWRTSIKIILMPLPMKIMLHLK